MKKKMIPTLVLGGLVLTLVVAGIYKSRERRLGGRISGRRLSPQEREELRKGNVRLDEYEMASWHG